MVSVNCPHGYVRDTAQGQGQGQGQGQRQGQGQGLCRAPTIGYYADSSGQEQDCESISGGVTGGIAEVVSGPRSCSFQCERGYVKNGDDRSCGVPPFGSYFDMNGNEHTCDPVLNAQLESKQTVGGGPLLLRHSHQCPFTCPLGYVKNAEDRGCCPLGHIKAGNACRPVRSVVDIGAGTEHTCLVLDDKSVKCWGQNDAQQKNGNAQNSAAKQDVSMVTVNLGQGALDVESGWKHTCALLEDRSVKCWGRNTEGQTTRTGSGTSNIVQVNLGRDRVGKPLGALEIDVGPKHTCALWMMEMGIIRVR